MSRKTTSVFAPFWAADSRALLRADSSCSPISAAMVIIASRSYEPSGRPRNSRSAETDVAGKVGAGGAGLRVAHPAIIRTAVIHAIHRKNRKRDN